MDNTKIPYRKRSKKGLRDKTISIRATEEQIEKFKLAAADKGYPNYKWWLLDMGIASARRIELKIGRRE